MTPEWSRVAPQLTMVQTTLKIGHEILYHLISLGASDEEASELMSAAGLVSKTSSVVQANEREV